MAWTKIDIIHQLAAANAAASYLEICTPTTGNRYAELDRSRFAVCHRLMSLCPDRYDDGLKIDYRRADKEIAGCVKEIARSGMRYDVILVDPWHEYDTSMQALAAALDLSADGGTVVVHDCLPTVADEATPQYRPGAWCGLTFKAYLDFLVARPQLSYCTVDTDYGCGLIRRLGRRDRLLTPLRTLLGRFEPRHRARVEEFAAWRALGDNHAAAYQLLCAHRARLLNLCSVDEFRAGTPRWLTAA